jgi:hypothetical protein
MNGGLEDAIADGDLDELLRWIDRLVDAADWDGLVHLRDRCRQAFHETGRQLWPAASNAEYRLALDAPPEWAASVLVEGAGHFALGPLPEVVASTHPWAELAPHAPPTPAASLCAHERVVRGERVDGEHRVLDLPLAPQEWEPAYCVATYLPDRVELPSPDPPPLRLEPLVGGGVRPVHDPDVERALAALVEPWVIASGGSVTTVAVEGTAVDAVALLHDASDVHWADVSAQDALARMAWAGASGGAHGRRRGAAMGRFGAWWAAAALTGLLDDWPPAADELGAAVGELRWSVWRPSAATRGWTLHLAVEDPGDGLAWAIAAVDQS